MKILIIEDNTNVVNALKQGLKYKSVVADHCMDGRVGLRALEEKFYDLCILDLGLPGMNGEDILKKAKKEKVTTPFLVLTASDDIETKTRLLEEGAEDYVEKPYSFEELYARIMAIMRRSSKSFPSEHLEIEDLRILPEKRMAMRDGKEVMLRGKEYDLLKYLMCHPNKVLSRHTLMEDVWGYSTSVLSNTVDAHISNLRNRIDKGYDKKFIKTIHGIGYMFVHED